MIDDVDRDPVASADRLTEAVATLTAAIEQTAADGRKNRRWVRLTAAGLVLDVLLTVVVVFGFVRTDHASNQALAATDAAHQLAQTARASCLATNTARTETVKLWENVIAKLTPPDPTAAEQAKDAEILALVEVDYPQRVCT